MENNNASQNIENGTTEQAATAPEHQTPQKAVATSAQQADAEAIISKAEAKATEAAEKKMEAVFKSMLQQQGLDADTISKMTQEWKSKQATPEQQSQEKDAALAAAKAENESLQRQIAALGRGIPADKAPRYIKLAESYVDEKTDFVAALDLAVADFPLERPEHPPAYAAGTGTNPMLSIDPKEAKKLKYLGLGG